MFFGGEEIVPELSESGEQQGRHLLVLYLASITFCLSIAGAGYRDLSFVDHDMMT